MDLKELGLTENEAKAYETLLRLGKTSAGHISKESGVPYGRIYNVLESLEEKGLVKVVPEKTKKYVPSDPSQLHDYVASRKQKLEEIEKKIKEYKTIYEEHGKEAVQVVTGKKNFYKIIRQMPKAQKYDYTIKYTFELHPEFIREAKRIKKQKIDYRVLGRIDPETEKNIREWKKIAPNIKPIKNEGIAMSLVDGKELMIAMIKSNTIMLVKDKPFIDLMEELFLNYYDNN